VCEAYFRILPEIIIFFCLSDMVNQGSIFHGWLYTLKFLMIVYCTDLHFSVFQIKDSLVYAHFSVNVPGTMISGF